MEDNEDYEFYQEEADGIFEFMLENGYIEIVTVDKAGDFVYKMTPRMIKDFPEIFEEHMEITNELVFSAWQKGFLEMTMDENANWTIIPSEKTSKYKEYEDDLTNEEYLLLWEINQMIDKGEV